MMVISKTSSLDFSLHNSFPSLAVQRQAQAHARARAHAQCVSLSLATELVKCAVSVSSPLRL
jgi:hypothetical protein